MFYWVPLTLNKSQVSYRMRSADVENHLEAQTETAWDGKQRQQRLRPGEVPGQEETQEDLSLASLIVFVPMASQQDNKNT